MLVSPKWKLVRTFSDPCPFTTKHHVAVEGSPKLVFVASSFSRIFPLGVVLGCGATWFFPLVHFSKHTMSRRPK